MLHSIKEKKIVTTFMVLEIKLKVSGLGKQILKFYLHFLIHLIQKNEVRHKWILF